MANDPHEKPGAQPETPQTSDEAQASERRIEARYPTSDEAELEVLPATGPPVPGTILDVSRSGLRLAIPVTLERGAFVKVKLQHTVVFGEVRYCRPVAGGSQVGILIQDLVRAEDRKTAHIAEEHLSLYAVGKGLTVTEVIELREHLLLCETCRARVAETEAILNAPKRNKARGSTL